MDGWRAWGRVFSRVGTQHSQRVSKKARRRSRAWNLTGLRPGSSTRFNKTLLDEFNRIQFRKRIYESLVELQEALDTFLRKCNEVRTHQGRWCYGKTPEQTFLDTLPLTKEKLQAA